ncbi:actin-regulating kinase prk1 [Dionaea muscipula]
MLLPFTRPITMKAKMRKMASQQKAFSSLSFILILTMNISITPTYGESSSDAQSLLQLKQSMVDDSKALSSWNTTSPPCFGNQNNWVGIICSRGGRVYGIRLEKMRLSGKIDVDSLLGLPHLRTISLLNNDFGGPMPQEINKLKGLRAMYLSYNSFQGKIDANAFAGMKRLKKVHLAHNQFSGQIPDSLAELNKLVELRLEGNRFEGTIPDFKQASFKQLDLSNNQLEGPIPDSLAKINPTAFAGNKALCGAPLDQCTPLPVKEQPSPDSSEPPWTSNNSKPILPIIIAALVVSVVAVVLLAILIIMQKKSPQNESGDPHAPPAVPKQVAAVRDMEHSDEGSCRSTSSTRNKGDAGKLCFIREDRGRFDLPDLLKASAEILGSGCFGSSYKANLIGASMVVVKRFKQMNNVGREDFQEHMRRLGRLDHPNLLPVVAYYYRKEEKLLVSDFVEKGSLAVHLHGNHSRGQPTLDWPTRLKVVKGVARGLAYLYKELPSLIAPHGHLKSSNVLLNESFEPMLNDYGLVPLINQESAQELMVAYKSPEYIANSRINKKTDVWSLGILIIETITGDFPASYLQRGTDQVDLTKWVDTVVGGGGGGADGGATGKVFDKDMGTIAIKNSEGEMQKLLKIGLACCESDVEKRMDIKEACERIEEVRERDNEDDFYSSYASEADIRSSRGLSEDFTVVVN